MRESGRETSTGWIAIGDPWKRNKIDEEIKGSTEPAPNQRQIGTKKNPTVTQKYKTKRRRKQTDKKSYAELLTASSAMAQPEGE